MRSMSQRLIKSLIEALLSAQALQAEQRARLLILQDQINGAYGEQLSEISCEIIRIQQAMMPITTSCKQLAEKGEAA